MFLKKAFLSLLLLSATALLLSSPVAAQSPSSIAINHVDTTNFPEVRVYVTVSDAQGNPITGLDKGNFALFEGGTGTSIDNLSGQLDQMFVVLMLDTSGSMLDPDPSGNLPINILKNAAASFVQSMAPQDVVAVYTFNERTSLRCDFTTDRQAILTCINNINAEAKWTALWDSGFVAVTKAAEIPRGRRAVVLFTDGDDNVSKLRVDDVVGKAKDSQIPVYTIAAGSQINARDLGRLALLTNAQSLTSQNFADLPRLFETLSKQLKSQYVLVYTSNAPEGRADLKVRVNFKGATQEAAVTFPVPALQAAIPPLVTQADSAQFPEVKVFVSVPSLPVGVPITPTLANFLLQEDGSRMTPSGLNPEKRGVLLQVLVDTSADLSQRGATQRAIWIEKREALLELTDKPDWLDKQGARDLVGFAASTDDPDRRNVPFTNDYNLLHNFAYGDKIPASAPVPFDQLLRQGIDAIIKTGSSDGRRRMMIVFSNGIPSSVDSTKLQELADVAKENGISVFVVYFGASESPSTAVNAVNLKRVANLANWRYYWYTSVAVIQSVYQQIGAFSKQYVIAYRSRAATSGKHRLRVAVRATEQSKVEAFAESQYAVTLAPPQVEVVLPLSGAFVRRGDKWDATAAETKPTTMPIEFGITWPDGHPRKISKLAYVVDKGPEISVNNPPSDAGSIALDITELGAGNHTIQITVQDELGLSTQTKEIAVPIRIELPAPPIHIQALRFMTGVFPIVALLISFVMLVAAVYVYRKRPAMVMGAVGAIKEGVKVATDFFVRPKAGERKPAKAYLVPIGGGDANQSPIPIRSEAARLGRDDSWANIVLQDTTVSRLHAKIVEEQDGGFRIYDEGSKSGTYVNEEEVGMSGQWLRDGDVIALGRDEFQFKLKLGPKEETEIFARLGKPPPAKEETDVTGRSAKEDTDVSVRSRSAKEETDVAARKSVKEETDVRTDKSAKEETDVIARRAPKEPASDQTKDRDGPQRLRDFHLKED